MKSRSILVLALLAFVSGCQPKPSVNAPTIKKGMIKLTVLYPNGEGKTFDMDYYTNKHFALVRELLGDSLKFTAIDKGLAAGAPDTPVPYLAVGYLYFDTMSSFQNSMKVHQEKLVADIPNFTNIQPIIQVSEVME